MVLSPGHHQVIPLSVEAVQKQLCSSLCKTHFLCPFPFSSLPDISLVFSKAVGFMFIPCGFSAVTSSINFNQLKWLKNICAQESVKYYFLF